ncbi:hypothetical protein MSAN_02012600 [Mycena sanguinolenta]|uniref:DUF6534 domain-containing protein n=1 Tax=Mycena sanguinolenta TaxID=230812 RepID=A0A8H6XLC2_9AGAR|nr:hypothetical protein MSAN_02012600 [Mycena sanguinolenta]
MSSSGPLTGADLRLSMLWLGPWLVGGCLDLFLQGILSAQFVSYFSFYKDDKTALRIVVMILAVMSVLKSIHSFAVVWIQSIVYFGDLQGAILLNYTTWWQSGTPLIVALCGLYVQSYFCYRLWVISKTWYVVLPIAIIFVFGFLSVAVATYFISVDNSIQISNWFAAHLGSVFAGDVLMSSATAYFLIKSKTDVLPQTVGLINSLVRLTFQTAAPVAICAMFNLAFSQLPGSRYGIISTAFNEMLPKLYAISMMYTLNARRTIRASGPGISTTSNEISGGRSRTTRRHDIELGAIHVVTQTETHVDVLNGGRDLKDDPYSSPRKSDGEEQYK